MPRLIYGKCAKPYAHVGTTGETSLFVPMEAHAVFHQHREDMQQNATDAETNEDRHVRVQLVQRFLAH